MTKDTQIERNDNAEIRVISIALIGLLALLICAIAIAVTSHSSRNAALVQSTPDSHVAGPALDD